MPGADRHRPGIHAVWRRHDSGQAACTSTSSAGADCAGDVLSLRVIEHASRRHSFECNINNPLSVTVTVNHPAPGPPMSGQATSCQRPRKPTGLQWQRWWVLGHTRHLAPVVLTARVCPHRAVVQQRRTDAHVVCASPNGQHVHGHDRGSPQSVRWLLVPLISAWYHVPRGRRDAGARLLAGWPRIRDRSRTDPSLRSETDGLCWTCAIDPHPGGAR